ncbi:hypothetical protein BV455_02197 [Parageobacillus caldoxylosilyticus]|nr:hypothetical protein BV455_02197 [Parageobacillus caldoxylosilyticus]BDG37471.1 hypothetical protein PcaKH15_33770 [Parageobacillus caldoxylosilyticus]BDG41262.1 hypothetical protein PcaKH16_34010 [Parageobacillus caldoxylosilyticus]BDG45017.1 hypothetical protein PcaKH35_33620 [Parageobacillus caldoxylosilyticus]
MKKANMAKRIAVIRLIMQGYLGIQVAELLNIHRETVMHIYHRLSSSDKKENARIMELLDFDLSIPDEDRKNELKKFIEREIFGMFNKIHTEEDLLMELKKRDHLNDIPLCVKKYFKLEDVDEC